MADRHPGFSKKSPQSRKKKKNKSSKKKFFAASILPKCGNKSNLSKESKFSFVHGKDTFTDEDNLEDNVFVIGSHSNEHQDIHSSKGKNQKHSSSDRGKHSKHDSSNFGTSRLFARNLRDGEDGHERNHVTDRKTFCETMFNNSKISNQNIHSSENKATLLQKIEYLNGEVDSLSQENMRLTDTLNNIKYNWCIHSHSDVDIIFKKQHLEEKFSIALSDLVSKLLNGNITVEELKKFCSSGKDQTINKSSEPPEDCLFAVDSFANTNQDGNTSIPIYDASFQEILESPTDIKNASPNNARRGGKCCFNCGEDHFIGTCPYELNYRKIALARRRAKSNFVPSVRYHVHGKNENFKPGIISDELREALGLQKNQIPLYVYNMRVIDYPPGWLSEAAVESSGMILYDSEGKALKEENCEDGEVNSSHVRVQYDPDKLIDYPGFNVPLPPDMIDESNDYQLPPLQTQQLRCFVEKYMTKPNMQPSRRRKLIMPSNKPSKLQRCEEDMEIVEDSDHDNCDLGDFQTDFVPPLPESAPPPPPPPPPPPIESSDTSQDMILSKFTLDSLDDNSASLVESAVDHFKIKSCSDFSSGTSSPSLAELEEIKKKLVMELCNSVDDAPLSDVSQDGVCNVTTNLNESKPSEDLYILEAECIGSEDSNEVSNISDSSSTLNKSSGSLKQTTNQSKCMALGTPSLSCHSPYVKLPDYDQFSKNVSAHINFENLPDSTGTYARMKNVLKKVKDKLNLLMK